MTKESHQLRPLNSAGMFDLFKGVFLIQIVLVHTIGLYNVRPPVFVAAFGAFPMAAFFMTNGYGFRKRSAAKYICQQRKTLLVPYICTGIAATLFHGIVHYCFFHLKESAIIESGRILVGFALGLSRTTEYFGYTAFACGLWWFVLSMTFGLVLLLLLLKLPDQKMQWSVMIVTSLVGWLLCQYRRFEIPYCISRAMAILPYLYVGYLAKKKKWLESSLPVWYIVLLIVCTISSAFIYNGKDEFTDISNGVWAAGPFSIIMDGVIGFFAMWVFARLGRYNCKLIRFFETIGSYSFEIICVHTVESYAPWYLLPPKFEEHVGLGIAVAFLMRTSIIILGCLLVFFVKKILATARKKKDII